MAYVSVFKQASVACMFLYNYETSFIAKRQCRVRAERRAKQVLDCMLETNEMLRFSLIRKVGWTPNPPLLFKNKSPNATKTHTPYSKYPYITLIPHFSSFPYIHTYIYTYIQ